MESIDLKVCSKCNKEKPFSAFGLDNRKEDKKRVWCKDCVNGSARQSVSRNPTATKSSNLELASFTPRQLIDELRARGYTGELLYTQKIKL